MNARFALGLVLSLLPVCTVASQLSLPDAARQLGNQSVPFDNYDLPTGPFLDGAIEARRFEGRIRRQTWRIDGLGATTLQLFAPLRDQVEAAGYKLIFECADKECGGYDFRFGTEVAPAPNMHVDIRDFRFLSAVNEPGSALSLLVSRSRNASHIQIIQVDQADEDRLPVVTNGKVPVVVPDKGNAPLAESLASRGHVVLPDLAFNAGAADLDDGPYLSLEQLAAFLKSEPEQRIALVGHTDSSGSLEANIALSKRRAGSVKARLVESYGIEAQRVDAEGMGYLAPVASNLTKAGREANRRVEAILLSAN